VLEEEVQEEQGEAEQEHPESVGAALGAPGKPVKGGGM
jgi:hypothetical protein